MTPKYEIVEKLKCYVDEEPKRVKYIELTNYGELFIYSSKKQLEQFVNDGSNVVKL